METLVFSFFLTLERGNTMVDVYHLFKLGTSAAKILKASKGAYDATVIFKNVWKPMVTMGVMGFVDAATEEATDKIIKELTDGSSR